jgi:hypothetical protein
MNRQLATAILALVSLSILAGCGDDDDSADTATDVQEANTAFCQDLGAYGDSLTSLADLDPATATKADYEDAADAVRSARSDLSESSADLAEAERKNLDTQADDLNGALEDASDDAVVADILAAAQQQVTELKVSIASLDTAVCTSGNSTTTAAS